MTRTSLYTLLLFIPLIQGCQRQPSEDHVNKMEVSKMNEGDNLLSKEEARKALLDMLAKEEVRRETLSKIWNEESDTQRKIRDEYLRKEKELLETTKFNEDVEQALRELTVERDKQYRNASSHYGSVEDKFLKEERDRKEKERLEMEEFNEDAKYDKLLFKDYDKLFEDYVVISITEISNTKRRGDWECDLKTGWFRKSGVPGYYYFDSDDLGRCFNAEHGRFRKNVTIQPNFRVCLLTSVIFLL